MIKDVIKESSNIRNYQVISELPEEILKMIFSYLIKSEVVSTALACRRFSGIFSNSQSLREIILNNINMNYFTMNNKLLYTMMNQRPNEREIILRIAHDRFKEKKLNLTMLRLFIKVCALQDLYKYGRFIGLKCDSNESKEELILGLLKKVVCSAEYYSGQPESKNSLFISLVNSLAYMDSENMWKNPKLLENTISIFQYVYLSLEEGSQQKRNLSELFNGFFENELQHPEASFEFK